MAGKLSFRYANGISLLGLVEAFTLTTEMSHENVVLRASLGLQIQSLFRFRETNPGPDGDGGILLTTFLLLWNKRTLLAQLFHPVAFCKGVSWYYTHFRRSGQACPILAGRHC